MMVYRPRYLDKKRNRSIKKKILLVNGELVIAFPDNGCLVYTKEGIVRRNPKGNVSHYYVGHRNWFSANEIESGVIHG